MISVNDNDKNLNKLVNNTKKKEEKGKTSSPDTSEKDKKQGQMPIRRGRNAPITLTLSDFISRTRVGILLSQKLVSW